MPETDIIWPGSIEEARTLQERDRDRIQIRPLGKEPEYVAGADALFSGDMAFGTVCLFRFPEMRFVEQSSSIEKATFPYIPGYLLFREGPAIVSAVKKMITIPDLILIDGHGIAHPREIGSASHLGLLLDIPTIGCAKAGLTGEFGEPGTRRGSVAEIRHGDRIVGAVLRTRDGVRPVFVSPGHKINLDDSIRIVLRCAGRYRIPEPLRCADIISRKMRNT